MDHIEANIFWGGTWCKKFDEDGLKGFKKLAKSTILLKVTVPSGGVREWGRTMVNITKHDVIFLVNERFYPSRVRQIFISDGGCLTMKTAAPMISHDLYLSFRFDYEFFLWAEVTYCAFNSEVIACLTVTISSSLLRLFSLLPSKNVSLPPLTARCPLQIVFHFACSVVAHTAFSVQVYY